MVDVKIKTDRTMLMDGNWCDTKVTVIDTARTDEPPALGVAIGVDGSRTVFLLDELRAIIAFAEAESDRITEEWKADNAPKGDDQCSD